MGGGLWKFLFLELFTFASCLFYRYPTLNLSSYDGGDPGEPLFLTQYVESGNIVEGRRLARVPFTDALNIKSYAGYFTVNKTYDSNQFFWYFPAMNPKSQHSPVVVWLQGGPGASSLYGLFTENGPIKVIRNKLERRKLNWALNHHIIYIDNPVGTGFSFTKDPKGYCSTETQVGEELYSSLIQFFKLFPDLQQNNFFVTGESYGGKYVPALAYTIHKKNQDAQIKVNLKGVAIGNGLSDPEHQLLYGKYLYQLGLIDHNQAQIFKQYEDKMVYYIRQKKYLEASKLMDELILGDFDNGTLFYNMTGYNFYFNFLHSKDYIDNSFGEFLQNSTIRENIHVGNLPFNDGKKVEQYLKQDIMQSVAPWISELLDHYSVVVYNGQLDIIVAYPLTVNYLKNLNFTGSDAYKNAKRYIWKVDGEVAGYVKEAGKLVEIMVRNAGHLVPADQPKWALDLITRLTHRKSFINKKETVKLSPQI